VGCLGVIGGGESAFALFDEAAGEHGRGVFLEPLIEQGGDLLAEIGGVAEARKLIGLQSIARSGEKKLPGGLGGQLRHGDLQRRVMHEYDRDINTVVIHGSSTKGKNGLWKTVEKQENAARCCSGCAGDNEDPDRTAWEEESDEVEEVKDVKEVEERRERDEA